MGTEMNWRINLKIKTINRLLKMALKELKKN